jgi:hypothetical protein
VFNNSENITVLVFVMTESDVLRIQFSVYFCDAGDVTNSLVSTVVSRALKKVRDNVSAECLQTASSLAQSSVNTGLIDATSLVDEFFATPS